jgi:RNA recognition motif-containing protein
MADQDLNEVRVSNLNYRTVGKSLREVFTRYGEVTDAQIITETTRYGDHLSRGFGFVKFATAEAAASALSAFPPIELDGRTLRVRPMWPRQLRKRDTIFVSGIPKGTTQDDLRAVFGEYNPMEIRIVREDSDDHRGFAFIKFDTEEHRTAAHHANRAFQLRGSESRVQFARRNISGSARPVRAVRAPHPPI